MVTPNDDNEMHLVVPGKEDEALEVSVQLSFFSTSDDLAQMGIIYVSIDPKQSSEDRAKEFLASCVVVVTR
jgi:hypothetical protein